MSALQITWFILVIFLLTVYAVLDGFDLGAGFWHLFAKKEDRPKIFKAIGPFWDGNEVWLLAGGGAIFAAFPYAYATVFSGFYFAFILLIFSMIFRAVAIEYRGRIGATKWQGVWDAVFAVGSTLPAFLFGVATGNMIKGLPLFPNGDFAGTFFSLLNPFAILTGLMTLALFASHGAAFLASKTDGELQRRSLRWYQMGLKLFSVIFIILLTVTLYFDPDILNNFDSYKALWLLPALIIFMAVLQKRFKPFFVSATIIVSLMMIFAAVLFPNIVPASNDTALTLTIANSSSSALTLKVMLIMTLIGMPFVAGYTVWMYRVFRISPPL